MANYRSTVLNSGSTALLRALGDGVKIPVGRFRVGDTFNYVPAKDSLNPGGNLVYTGDIGKIALDMQEDGELRVTLVFTEDVGNFSIGNVIIDLYVEDDYIPFLMWVSDIPIPKFKFDKVTQKIGNRINLSFTEKLENIDEALDITVNPVTYASLPQYSDEGTLPPANAALFQNPVLQNYTGLGRPVIAARRSVDENWFGFALLERLDNPFFGQFDAGISGRYNVPYTGNWIWGGYFDSVITEEINGGTFSTKDSEYGDTIQGEPLSYGAIE